MHDRRDIAPPSCQINTCLKPVPSDERLYFRPQFAIANEQESDIGKRRNDPMRHRNEILRSLLGFKTRHTSHQSCCAPCTKLRSDPVAMPLVDGLLKRYRINPRPYQRHVFLKQAPRTPFANVSLRHGYPLRSDPAGEPFDHDEKVLEPSRLCGSDAISMNCMH